MKLVTRGGGEDEKDVLIAELEARVKVAEDETDSWSKSYADFAAKLLRSTEESEKAAKELYKAKFQVERDRLLLGQRKLKEDLERQMLRARQDRDACQALSQKYAELQVSHSILKQMAEEREQMIGRISRLEQDKQEEPERIKQAKRLLAEQFARNRETLVDCFKREREQAKLEFDQNKASLLSTIERLHAETDRLQAALQKQISANKSLEKQVEKAARRAQEMTRLTERIKTLEDYIRTQEEQKQSAAAAAVSATTKESPSSDLEKAKNLYRGSLARLQELATENDALRNLAAKATLDLSRASSTVVQLKHRLYDAESTADEGAKAFKAVLDNAEDAYLAGRLEALEEEIVEERTKSAECQQRLLEATRRFQREYDLLKASQTTTKNPRLE